MRINPHFNAEQAAQGVKWLYRKQTASRMKIWNQLKAKASKEVGSIPPPKNQQRKQYRRPSKKQKADQCEMNVTQCIEQQLRKSRGSRRSEFLSELQVKVEKGMTDDKATEAALFATLDATADEYTDTVTEESETAETEPEEAEKEEAKTESVAVTQREDSRTGRPQSEFTDEAPGEN